MEKRRMNMTRKWKIAGQVAAASVLLLATHAYAEDEIDQLQKKVQESQQQKTQLEQAKQQVELQLSQVQEKLQQIRNELEATRVEIVKAEGEIQRTEGEIIAKEQEILQREQELEQKREVLAKSIRFLYAKGEASLWEIVFGSDELSLVLQRVEVLNRVSSGNQKLVKKVKQMAEEAKQEKQKLEQVKQEQEVRKQSLVQMRESQVQKEQEQAVLINQLREKQKELQEDIQQEENEMNSIEAQIVSVVRKREEERKRREAQAAQTTSGGVVQKSSASLSIPMRAGTYQVTSGYGYRSDPFTGETWFHNGIDYGAAEGVPIYAAAAGEVLYSGKANGYGHWIVVACDNGLYTIYGHMYASGLHVKVGERVERGQYIADVGSDGRSTGPHLHFSVANGFSGSSFSYVNPSSYY